MAMKLTVSIFCLLLVAVVTGNSNMDAYNKCHEEYNGKVITIAPEKKEELTASLYDCMLQAFELITPDKKFDFGRVKDLLSLELNHNDGNSAPTQESVNNMVEKCKSESAGSNNRQILAKMKTCLSYELEHNK